MEQSIATLGNTPTPPPPVPSQRVTQETEQVTAQTGRLTSPATLAEVAAEQTFSPLRLTGQFIGGKPSQRPQVLVAVPPDQPLPVGAKVKVDAFAKNGRTFKVLCLVTKPPAWHNPNRGRGRLDHLAQDVDGTLKVSMVLSEVIEWLR